MTSAGYLPNGKPAPFPEKYGTLAALAKIERDSVVTTETIAAMCAVQNKGLNT